MAGIAAALAAAATPLLAQQSPVGSWDVVLRGDQKGVAQLTFNPDYTITGTEVITIKPAPASDDDNPRGTVNGGIRVNGTPTSTNSVATTNFFGASPITGIWQTNLSGLIIGILSEGDSSGTNGISFRGKRSGSRLNLVGHHEKRTINYRGVPLTTLADISGNFYATGKKEGESYIELFNLTADDDTPNRYIVTGQGPSYDFVGIALLSGQNQLAIASLQSIGTNGVLSAVSGGYNFSKRRGSLTGVDENHDRVTAKISGP